MSYNIIELNQYEEEIKEELNKIDESGIINYEQGYAALTKERQKNKKIILSLKKIKKRTKSFIKLIKKYYIYYNKNNNKILS